jgi:hypothetical protein
MITPNLIEFDIRFDRKDQPYFRNLLNLGELEIIDNIWFYDTMVWHVKASEEILSFLKLKFKNIQLYDRD